MLLRIANDGDDDGDVEMTGIVMEDIY